MAMLIGATILTLAGAGAGALGGALGLSAGACGLLGAWAIVLLSYIVRG